MAKNLWGSSRGKLFTLFTFCGLLFTGYSQPCPGFQPGVPGNPNYELNFYDAFGNLVGTCDCQLTGNGFKCGNCMPSMYYFFQYISGGSTVTCVNGIVLPVTLSSFTATASNGNVRLDWITETEQSNKKFLLEHSTNGTDYTLLAEVDGTGNSDASVNYSVTDPLPAKGINYYRLSQEDINGTVVPLQVLSIELIPELTQIVLVPNPAKGTSLLQLPLHGTEQEFSVVVTDGFGKERMVFTTTENQEMTLPAGYYFVTVHSGNQTWQEKLVILD